LLLPILVGYFSLQDDCNKTLSLNSTISQQRSIEARVDSSQKAIQLLKTNKLGYGAGTYSLVNSERFEDSDIPFTSFAPNCIAQLFVEKGVAMLDELERDIAQIIAIYTQSNKYIPQLEKYSSIYIVKRSRMSSADINAWKAIAKQALNIDLRADKISKKLNEEYAFPFGFEILSKEDKKHDLLTDYIIGARAIIGF